MILVWEWKHGNLIIQEWNDDRHTSLGMDVWQCIVPTQLCITSLNNDRSVYSMLIETGSYIITTSPVNSLPQFYTHYRESTSYSYAHVCVPVTTGVELFFCHADAAIDFFSSLPSTEREREGNAKLYYLHYTENRNPLLSSCSSALRSFASLRAWALSLSL